MKKSICLAAAVAGMFIGNLSADARDELSMSNRR